MSKKTRINRPTTATPRNLHRERMVHVSTNIVKVGPGKFLKQKGNTLRRSQNDK